MTEVVSDTRNNKIPGFIFVSVGSTNVSRSAMYGGQQASDNTKGRIRNWQCASLMPCI